MMRVVTVEIDVPYDLDENEDSVVLRQGDFMIKLSCDTIGDLIRQLERAQDALTA